MGTQTVSNQEPQSQNIKDRLVQRIREKRAVVKEYAKNVQRRSNLLTNLNITCTGLAAVLTAGPALGGIRFTETMQSLFNLNSDSPIWKTLCFLALVLSLIALIANNIYRTNDLANRLAKAQSSSALLEGLETMLEFGLYSVEDATKMYQQYISDVAFIEGI